MEPRKVCPLAASHPQQENSDCLGEACACHVKMQKPHLMQTGNTSIVDPESYLSLCRMRTSGTHSLGTCQLRKDSRTKQVN